MAIVSFLSFCRLALLFSVTLGCAVGGIGGERKLGKQ